MSLLFYRRPEAIAKLPGPLDLAQCQAYVERTQKHRRAIPPELSFENVTQDNSLPPCSLDDFMQYLVHVSHDAENLQFWLWLQDYIKKFLALPRSEQALSPPWSSRDATHVAQGQPPQNFNKAMKGLSNFGVSLESLAVAKPPTPARNFDKISFDSGAASSHQTIAASVDEANAQAGLKWQSFTIQPFRSEIDRVISHYLSPNAPRELNLSQRNRDTTLHALQHTTHPTAFALVGDLVEADLRGQSHPNFIRWSICNGNKARVIGVRNSGIAHVAAGLILAIVLVLSDKSRWWRLFAAPLFLVGFSIGVAAYRGLCVIIHSTHTRALRPWEQVLISNSLASFAGTFEEEGGISLDDRSSIAPRHEKGISFDPFGNPNSEGRAIWEEKYRKTPLIRKIFSPQVWVQDETMRMLQDRIVIQSHLWSVLITVPLTAFFIALPESGVF